MPSPIALQLYTLREAIAKDFAGVIRHLADAGYVGVELAGFSGTTPQEANALFKDLNLTVAGAHTRDLPVGGKKNEVLDLMGMMGCNYIILPFLPADALNTGDKVKAVCDNLNEASANARERGMKVGYHNHSWEFESIGEATPHQLMRQYLDPSVFFEIDTYWAQTAGANAAEVVKELGSRAPLLHIKDGPATKEDPMTAVGEGVMDVPAIVAAGEGSTEWLIVELDRCATDMMEAVEKSYTYLVGKGLARGNRS